MTTYNIYKKIPGEQYIKILENHEDKSFADPDIVDGSTYIYKIAAVNDNNEESEQNKEIRVIAVNKANILLKSDFLYNMTPEYIDIYWIKYGNAKIENNSLVFNNTGTTTVDYLVLPSYDIGNMIVSSIYFTIRFYVKVNDIQRLYHPILSFRQSAQGHGWTIDIDNNTLNFKFQGGSAAGSYTISADLSSINISEFFSVSIERCVGYYYIYINNVLIGIQYHAVSSTNVTGNTRGGMSIGTLADNTQSSFNGAIKRLEMFNVSINNGNPVGKPF